MSKQVTCTATSGITTLFYIFFRVKNSTSVESVQYILSVLYFFLTLVLKHTIGNEFNQYLEYPKALFKWSN
jgi:hypothetical protein